MLNTPRKKRAPLSQLRDMAQKAHEVMVGRNISYQENVLENIAKDSKAPILPGLPRYLPHKWTIDAARLAMFSMLMDWAEMTKNDDQRQDSAPEFFRYVVKRMVKEERKYRKDMNKTEASMRHEMKEAPLLSDIFSPVRKYQTARALHKFFIDSFAISIMAESKSDGSTTRFTEWFLGEWTPALYDLWKSKDKTVEGRE